jgi:ATP-dependent RNA helicase DDX10/DBP4
LTFKEKKSGVLISTNISARGLDIPQVKWIIQVDCPESSETYVHRVGRTARFAASGKSVLFLDESEQAFIEQLKLKGVEVKKIKPD